MKAAVIDASVAVKWFVRHDLTERARRAYANYELVAPSLILAEIGNALWKYHRAGVAGLNKIKAAFDGIEFRYFRTQQIDETLSMRALEIAVELGHPIYDCYYLALSRSLDAPVISDDRKLLSKARAGGYRMIGLTEL
jgi:predicted nucleic acid-binding protein